MKSRCNFILHCAPSLSALSSFHRTHWCIKFKFHAHLPRMTSETSSFFFFFRTSPLPGSFIHLCTGKKTESPEPYNQSSVQIESRTCGVFIGVQPELLSGRLKDPEAHFTHLQLPHSAHPLPVTDCLPFLPRAVIPHKH